MSSEANRASPDGRGSTKASPDGLRLRIGAREDRLPVVSVEGEIDLATAARLERALGEAAATGGPVIVDLGRCSFIDSTGIAALLRAGSARNGGAATALAICAAGGQVDRTLELTDVGRLIPIFATAEEAARALGAD